MTGEHSGPGEPVEGLLAEDQANRSAAVFADMSLIDAPAGSGKTETIVARILREVLVGHGDGPVPVERIVAATFTLAAAAELRGRARTRLEELRALVALGPTGAAPPEFEFVEPLHQTLVAAGLLTPEAAIQRIDRSLDHLDDAPWGTLHSVCNWIVGRSAAQLPIPAAVGFLDADARQQLIATASTTLLTQASARIDACGDSAALLTEVTDTHLSALAAAISEQVLGQGARPTQAGELDVRTPVTGLMEVIDEGFTTAADRLAGKLNAADAELVAHPGVTLSETLTRLLPGEGEGWPDATTDVIGYLATVLAAGAPTASPGRRRARTNLLTHKPANNLKNVTDSPSVVGSGHDPEDLTVVRLKGSPTKFRAWINTHKKSAALWGGPSAPGDPFPTATTQQAAMELAVGHLIDAALSAEVANIALRRSIGALTFDDLIDLAVTAVPTDGSWTQPQLGLFDLLVIDELQDSDPLQHQFLTAVEAAGVPVVAVGDVRQSIYRFRGARPELFTARSDSAQAAGTAVRLTRTFRHPADLALAFNALFATTIDSAGVPPPNAVSTKDPHTVARAPLAIALVEKAGNAEESRLREAEAVVGELLRLRGLEDLPTPWSQLAVLLPVRTSLPAITHALAQHRIPYMVVAASGLASTAEVRGLHAAMRWVVSGHRIDQAAAWTSPWFARPITDLLAPPTEPPPHAPDASPGPAGQPGPVPSWQELRARRWELAASPAGDAALEILRILGIHTRLRELSHLDANLADHMSACTRYVLGEAMAAQETGASLADHIRDMTKDVGDDLEALRKGSHTGDERDAVRINTIHGAKGLEYQHVVLAGISSRPKAESLALVWPDPHSPERWIGGKLKDSLAVRPHPTKSPDDIKAITETQRQAEGDRLLYVALTRAMGTATALVETDPPPVAADGPTPDLVQHWLDSSPAGAPPIQIALHSRLNGLRTVDPGPGTETLADGAIQIRTAEQPSCENRQTGAGYEWGETPALTPIRVRPTTPASGLSHSDGSAPPDSVPQPAPVEPATSPGAASSASSGRHFGTAVHACVDLLARRGLPSHPEAQLEHAHRAARSVVAGRPDTTLVEDVADAALSVLRSPALTSYPGQVRNEVRIWAPLTHEDTEIIGGGIIDILVTTDTGWHVIDIKTDAIPPAGPEALAVRYGPQLRMYADALESAGAPPVTELGLLLTSCRQRDGNAAYIGIARGE